MVQLSEILDADLLTEHIANGLVSARRHESLPLEIFNYTPEAAYSRHWDDVTKKCRGLIFNYETGEVVARPFEKFFNWDEAGSPFPPSGPALRMEKMDGSLGILYPVYQEKFNNGNGGRFVTDWRIATRGSMHSEQAQWATEYFNEYMFEQEMKFAESIGTGNRTKTFSPDPSKTYLFEIIYPENRIVVDYGDYKGLMLLDVIDNETGFSDTDEFDNCEWPEKVVRTMVPGFDSGQVVDIADGEEGFVYLWPTRNFRTKMKSAEYIRIHRLVSSLSEKSVWESLVAGKTLDEIKIGLPEEFHKFVDDVNNEIMSKVYDILLRTGSKFADLCSVLGENPEDIDRKAFALAVGRDPDKKYLFMLLDNRDVYPVALHAAKPTKAKALVTEE
jgi:RNA ligase